MDASERRALLLLAMCQALTLSAIVLSMMLAGILGGALAPDRSWATAPIAAIVIGTAITSLPASFLMRRIGRRNGFVVGAAIGFAGSAVAGAGLHVGSFALFTFGHVLIGAWQGFGNYHRFAAAEVVGEQRASRAISWVVAGGVVAAFAGPQLGVWGRDWIGSQAFLGAYVAQAALALIAMLLLQWLHVPRRVAQATARPRPLRAIAAQPAVTAAVVGATAAYAVMILAMTATPLAMVGCGFGANDVKPVIQWHVFGMFAPSFFTGSLIARYGAPRVMAVGFVLLLGHVAVAVSGVDWLHFLSALVLLGVGWNFAFVGGTALLTQSYRPAEQSKVQALNESIVFSMVAVASLGAGWLYERFGWATLNLVAVPLLLVALAVTVLSDRRLQAVAGPAR
jgi:predicted MFS family arabinose efflux permease